MTLAEVLQHVHAPECLAALAPGWAQSQESCPAGLPDFLDPTNAHRWRAQCGLPPAVDADLADAARRIAGDPALLALAWHASRSILATETDFLRWPDLAGALPAPGLFYLLVALGAVPVIEERCRLKGCAAETACTELGRLCAAPAGQEVCATAPVGLPPAALTRLQHQLGGGARIGRFVYVRNHFNGYFEIYRDRESERTVALALPDAHFTAQGLMDLDPEPGSGWVAQRRDCAEAVVGTPISPLGRALREEVRLPLAQWRRVVTAGDISLALHVPGGCPLDPAACRESMRDAFAFFAAYYPEPAAVCTLVSWIASPLVGKALPAGANLARFQQEAYLYPVPARGDEHLHRIFGPGPVDPAAAPTDTTHRKGVADHLRRGGKWYWGGLFFLAEGLPHFGAQWYRSRWL